MSEQYLSLLWGLLYYYPMEDLLVLDVPVKQKKVLTTLNPYNRTSSATTLYQFMIMLDTSFSDFRHFIDSRISDELLLSSVPEKILYSLLSSFYQSLINSFIENHHSDYSLHASYSRYIFVNDFKISLEVIRVKDRNNNTHAVLPSFLIPYKWYCVNDFLDIINDSHSSPSLNSFTYDLKAIMRAVFRKWIKDHSSFTTFDLSVIPVSFDTYHIQFLQNSNISNSLIFL